MTTQYTLSEILEAQRKHAAPQPTMEELQQTVLSVISRYQKPDRILAEVLTDVTQNDKPSAHDCLNDSHCQCHCHNVEDIIDLLQQQAEVTEVPFSSHSATWCASHLEKLLGERDGGQLLDSTLKKKVMVIIEVVRRCMTSHSHGLNRNLFVNALNEKMLLSVEMIWILHKEDIMSLDLFITNNCGKADVMVAFSSGLVNLSSEEKKETAHYRQKILKDCIGYLAVQAYGDSSGIGTDSKDLKKACISLLDQVTKEFLQNLESPRDVSIYEGALETLGDDTRGLQKFATRHLTLILGHNPNIQVSEALSNHSEWGFTKTPGSLQQAFAQLMLVFQEKEIMEVFHQFLEEQEVNWQTILTFVSTFLMCCERAAPVLQELISKYLQEGLEMGDIEGVISAFLLARHACSEGPHVFMTYAQWFQMTFSETSQNPASNKKTFSFLMKFLTDIMPFEKAEFLKVHLTKPPFVPEKCRPLMSDYVTLAKTRLMDLKEPFENVGIYEENAGGDSDMNQIESDVEKAIAGFAKTRKVPLTVMEASMFRKPYYMGRFLPALLKPRPLPDDPDDRMSFIEALWQANKIPVNLYNNYTKACKKESAMLLEGIFSDGDESMDEMVLEPIDQLQHSLNKLKENLVSKSENVMENTITGDISVIADKIQLVLSTANISKSPGKVVVIDLDAPVIHPLSIQIVDLILNVVCEMVESTESQTWVTLLYLAMTEQNILMQALTVRLWDLLILQGSQMDTVHLTGLTAILIHLLTFLDSGQLVVYKKTTATLQEHFISALTVKTKEEMQFVVRFLLSYLSQAFSRFQSIDLPCSTAKPVVPPEFVTMFAYLGQRLFVETREKKPLGGVHCSTPSGVDVGKEVSALLSSQCFNKILEMSTRWSLLDWVTVECSIDAKDDALTSSERFSYHRWYLYKFLWNKEAGVLLRDIAKKLFVCLLELDMKNNMRKPGKPEMVKLVSELLSVSVNMNESDSHILWSHECFSEWMNQKETSMEKHEKICVFVRNLFDLPPHLLFTEDVRSTTEDYVSDPVDFINDFLVDHMCEGITLDHQTLCYILQGLATLSHHLHEEYVMKVLHRVPSITLSIMMHWDQTSVQVQAKFHSGSPVTKYLQKIQKVLQIFRTPDFSVASLEGGWMECVALFRAFMFGDLETDAIPRIVSVLLSMDRLDVLEVWMTLNLCHLAYLHLRNETTRPMIRSISREILRSCPIALGIFKGGCHPKVPNRALPAPLIRALPFTTARLFLDIEQEGKWPNMLKDGHHLLSDLITTHIACVKIYHEQYSEAPNQELDATATGDVQEMSALVKMVSESIKICPASRVKGISKDIFRDCDYSIQVMLRKKVPGHFS